MIKEFKNNPVRKSAIVYGKMLETAKKWYMRDPVKGGEYAISFLEAVLTGQISSDDINIEDALEGYIDRIENDKNRYDAKVAATEEKYRKIIRMKKSGMTQADIARALGVQPPAVSKMFTKIRSDYPHLLEEEEETSGNILDNSGNISNFQETLETKETLAEVSESFQETEEILEGIEETGNVSNVSKVSPYNYSYNYNQDYNYNESGKTSSFPPVGSAHVQDLKEKMKLFDF